MPSKEDTFAVELKDLAEKVYELNDQINKQNIVINHLYEAYQKFADILERKVEIAIKKAVQEDSSKFEAIAEEKIKEIARSAAVEAVKKMNIMQVSDLNLERIKNIVRATVSEMEKQRHKEIPWIKKIVKEAIEEISSKEKKRSSKQLQ